MRALHGTDLLPPQDTSAGDGASVPSANLCRPVTPHTFRPSFATHVLESGTDVRTIEALLGHKGVATTMIYAPVMKQTGIGVRGPLDR